MSQKTMTEADGHAFGETIMHRLNALAACTDEPGRITRPYLGPAHRQAVDLIFAWMTESGLAPRLDASGNVVGRYPGIGRDAPLLLIGSHIDSVPNAGMFDGNLGVATAIAVVAHCHAAGRRFPFAIEVVAFGDEEGSRFPSTLGGSRLLAGTFDRAILDETDAQGVTRRAALSAFGCDPARIPDDGRRAEPMLGYVEVHIEQGPVLESKGLAVGVVSSINGATRGTVEVRGTGGHAGTIPMHLRQDAYCAAAEMALAIERRAREDDDLVATVGCIDIPGGVVNSVPGLARFSIDLRSSSDQRRLAAMAELTREMQAIAARRRVEIALSFGYQAPATACDPRLSSLLAEAVEAQGVSPLRLPSGAGHDAMSFRERLPVAMLFVRCRAGVSHSPEEFAAVADIDIAARSLLDFLNRLAAVT
jgi:allantoate deiminase